MSVVAVRRNLFTQVLWGFWVAMRLSGFASSHLRPLSKEQTMAAEPSRARETRNRVTVKMHFK